MLRRAAGLTTPLLDITMRDRTGPLASERLPSTRYSGGVKDCALQAVLARLVTPSPM
jgi:hypothetical protein